MSAPASASKPTMDDAPLSGFHKRLALFSSGGPFLDGYILAIIGLALVQLVPRWHIDAFWSGMIGASSLIGIFIGGPVFGYVTDRVGRRVMYMVDLVVIIACSIAQFFVTDIAQLFWLRLLIGIAVGADYPIATALVTEFAPTRWRAKLVGGYNAMWFVGATVASFVGFGLLNVADGWRWMLLSAAVPALAIVVARAAIPESPRWLASKGRGEEALRILRNVLGPSATLDDLPERSQKTSIRRVVQAGYLGRTVFVSVFWTATVVTLFAIYAFGPQILSLLQLSKGNESNLGYGLINVFFLVGNIAALAVIDRLGRRPVLIWGFAISGLGLLYLGINPAASVAAVAVAFAVYAVFNGGPSVLEWIYPNELFPTEIRATAVGIGTGVSRIGAAIGTWATPWALKSLGVGPTMLIAAGIAFIGAIVGFFMAPETKGRPLHETAAVPHRRLRLGAPAVDHPARPSRPAA